MSNNNAIETLKKTLCQYMKQAKLTDLVGEKRNILQLKGDLTVKECIQQLTEKEVRSAPLVPASSSKVFAFVDFVDLVAYLLDLASNNPTIQHSSISENFMQTPIEKVANYSKQDSYSILDKTASVYDAALELSKGSKRVLILDESKKNIINIVTHTDVIELFKKFIDTHQNIPMGSITAEQLKLYGPAPVYVREDCKAIDAYQLMIKENTSFVPVISDDKELLSVVSARDLKVVGAKNDFSILGLPVLDFVSITRQASTYDKYPYIWCKHDSSFDVVIKRLKATHVHRLVLIDDKKFPTGVVNVQNVIHAIVN